MNTRFLFSFIIGIALLAGTTAQAQTRVPARRPGAVAPRPRPTNMGAGMKDGLTMKDGRIILTELGISNPTTADKKLLNGVVISTTGLVTATDGTTTQLTEGDLVSLTGRVTTRRSIVVADSLSKARSFDLKYPGKRKKMEEDAERKAKVKAKLAEDKAKIAEKRARDKEKSKR
ncbi:DUF6799 domain-containing protein [Hymenobacter glacialis]|uniref:DUF6799 domain-containing protein n=1 Tax=Hymenobacter glacialis TaxID=1908236 RepID=A0A1G1T3V4_9BACT|nr:DUF6799 domain-containing protein [Hymenobacter glacialis]OGX85544.1 hypothetical protein BEN48_01540 [Hymenobacter glacialis]